MIWFNFDTGKDEVDNGDYSPEKLISYIPNNNAARGLYRCYIELGDPPLKALERVLSKVLGVKED